MVLGIDFGAKTAGTTAVCYLDNNKLTTNCAVKIKNADDFIAKTIASLHPNQIFIDAPLSLPKAYFGKGKDYHYRTCDRLAQAMSPMFLGGLTARAIAIKNQYPEIEFFETYPKMVAQTLNLTRYKNNIDKSIDELNQHLPYPLKSKPKNWHEFDAVLAWMGGYRYQNNEAESIGDPDEGVIFY